MHKLFSLKDKTLLALISLMAIFITASNYLVQFPINFFGLKEVLTYGAFTYPVTF